MPQSRGYAVWSGGGKTIECDTITCKHCQRIVFLKPPANPTGKPHDPGGFCRICLDNICGPCADKGTCTPFLKRLEIQEGRRRLTDVVIGGA